MKESFDGKRENGVVTSASTENEELEKAAYWLAWDIVGMENQRDVLVFIRKYCELAYARVSTPHHHVTENRQPSPYSLQTSASLALPCFGSLSLHSFANHFSKGTSASS